MATEEPTATAEPTEEPTVEAIETPTADPSGELDPALVGQTLVGFAEAWDVGDWTAMASYATPNVIEVAKLHYVEGGDASTNMKAHVETDLCADAPSPVCEFIYILNNQDETGTVGDALIFRATVGTVDGGIRVVDLQFDGDL